jgi:hypothetical protein
LRRDPKGTPPAQTLLPAADPEEALMKSVLINAMAASSVVALSLPASALAQEQEEPAPPEEQAPPPEAVPPPPVYAPAPPIPPPAVRPHTRRRGPAPPPAVIINQAPAPPQAAPRRDVVTFVEETPDTGMIGAGLLMFGLAYGSSIVVGATSENTADQALFVPLAGPWIDLANRGDCNGPCGPDETVNRVLLVSSGLFQAAGALQILGGFLFPETRTVTRTADVPAGVHFAPKVGKGMVGLSAYGSF